MPPKRRVQPLNLPNLFATTGFDSEKFRNEYYSTMPAGVANVEERDKALRAIEAMKRYNAKIFYTDKEIERRFLAKQVKEQRKKKYEQDVVKALSEYFEQNQVLPKDIPPKYKKLLREYIQNLQKHPPAGKTPPNMPDELNIPHAPLDPLNGMYVNKNGTVTTTPMPAIPSKLNPEQPSNYHDAIQVYQKMPEKNFIVIDITEPYFWDFADYAKAKNVPIIYGLDDGGYLYNKLVLPKQSAIAFAYFMNEEPKAKKYINLHTPPQVHIGFPGKLTQNYKLNMRPGPDSRVPPLFFPDNFPANFKSLADLERDEDLQRVVDDIGENDDMQNQADIAAAATATAAAAADDASLMFGSDTASSGANEREVNELREGEERKNADLNIPPPEMGSADVINQMVIRGVANKNAVAVMPMPITDLRELFLEFLPVNNQGKVNKNFGISPSNHQKEITDMNEAIEKMQSIGVQLRAILQPPADEGEYIENTANGATVGFWMPFEIWLNPNDSPLLTNILTGLYGGGDVIPQLVTTVGDLIANYKTNLDNFIKAYSNGLELDAKAAKNDAFLRRLRVIDRHGIDRAQSQNFLRTSPIQPFRGNGGGALNEDEYEAGAELYACGRINHFGPRRYLHQRVHPFVRLRPFDTPETMVREQTTKNDEMREKFRSEHKMVHGIDPSNERIATAMPTLAQPFNYDYLRYNMHSIPAKRSRYNFLGI